MKLWPLIFSALLCSNVLSSEGLALEQWNFQLTYESPKISTSAFELAIAADIDHNGVKEVIATDFGRFDSDYDRGYNLYILEWSTDQLMIKLKKHWDRYNPRLKSPNGSFGAGFQAYKTEQLKSWEFEGKTIVEAIPPFFEVTWDRGKYLINDRQAWEITDYDYLVGSWAFPWLSPACYPYFVDHRLPTWKRPLREPRECLIGIRDLLGNGNLKILTIYQEEIIKDKKYTEQLRIRDFKKTGFPIEWQMQLPDMFYKELIDRFNQTSGSGFILWKPQIGNAYYFDYDKNKKTYRLQSRPQLGSRNLEKNYSIPDFYLRRTQSSAREEYWGYHKIIAADGEYIWLLRKAEIGQEYTSFKHVDVDFDHHEPFIGVIDFNVLDVDGDGIDEIILVERTGIRKSNGESITFKDANEYVQILKWNGDKYQSMWVSPPYKLGASFLADDVMNKGKNQLMIFTPNGTVQIWERQ